MSTQTKRKQKLVTFNSYPVEVPASLWEWWLTPHTDNASFRDMCHMRACDLNEALGVETYTKKYIYDCAKGHCSTPVAVKNVMQRAFLQKIFGDKDGGVLADLLLF